MANFIPDDNAIREIEDLSSDLHALYDILNPPLTKYEIVELGEPEQKYKSILRRRQPQQLPDVYLE